jgi:hypothetical protein
MGAGIISKLSGVRECYLPDKEGGPSEREEQRSALQAPGKRKRPLSLSLIQLPLTQDKRFAFALERGGLLQAFVIAL